MSKKKGTPRRQSPYRKYAKREYVYSPAYQSWAMQFRPMKASQKRGNAA